MFFMLDPPIFIFLSLAFRLWSCFILFTDFSGSSGSKFQHMWIFFSSKYYSFWNDTFIQIKFTQENWLQKLRYCNVIAIKVVCIIVFQLAFFWSEMPTSSRVGMREGGGPLPVAFSYLILMVFVNWNQLNLQNYLKLNCFQHTTSICQC